jgi:hypothetical protein
MLTRKIAIACAACLCAGAAAAQTAILTAAEVRTELFGVRLSGVNEVLGAPWEECIEPGGRTVYRFAGTVMEGRLTIESDGLACFAYADDGFAQRSCFAVRREGANYRFDSFVTTRVARGVLRCEGPGAYVEAPGRAPAATG